MPNAILGMPSFLVVFVFCVVLIVAIQLCLPRGRTVSRGGDAIITSPIIRPLEMLGIALQTFAAILGMVSLAMQLLRWRGII